MKRPAPDRRDREIAALIASIKELNDASKFEPDPYQREQLLREKSALQSELLRNYGELFELLPEGRDTVGILGRVSQQDACHARLDHLDPDVRQWAKQQLKPPRGR